MTRAKAMLMLAKMLHDKTNCILTLQGQLITKDYVISILGK